MKRSLISAAGAGMAVRSPKTTWSKVRGANEDIRVAVCVLTARAQAISPAFDKSKVFV